MITIPSSMTHTYFGIDVYNNLPIKYQSKISNNLEHLKLFSQGSDPFMFYHFFIGKKAKQIKQIQIKIHQEKTQDYFINIIKYIHENSLQNNPEIITYLYGNICHYFLDLYTHPLIYYKSGIFKSNDKSTYKYNGLHQQIEYAIDLYFIKKNEQIVPRKFKIHNQIFNITSLSPELKRLIVNSVGKTHSITNSDNKYLKSIKYMRLFFYIANYDPYKIKLKLYKIIDKITPKKIIKLKELSFANIYPNINDYLNLNNKQWFYPWDNTILHTSSFIDLYNQAKNDTIKTIKEVTELLEDKILDINRTKKIFPDLSYLTGKPCNQKLRLKYFEF